MIVAVVQGFLLLAMYVGYWFLYASIQRQLEHLDEKVENQLKFIDDSSDKLNAYSQTYLETLKAFQIHNVLSRSPQGIQILMRINFSKLDYPIPFERLTLMLTDDEREYFLSCFDLNDKRIHHLIKP